jgi:transitional endoplasmic reticulum ATPase
MPSRWDAQPIFLKFGHMNEAELILSRPVQDSILVNVWTHIRHTAKVKADGTPIKRTVVLSGIYGTGKSMGCAVTAKLAQEHGWTVIYLDDTARLADALENAKRWQPCLLIAEDIDRVAEERTESANTIFNTLSGVLSASNDVMVMLTTNHPERIDQAMLRPGRIDALIEVTPPDAEAVQRLIHLYGRGLIKHGEKLDTVGAMLAGQIPATIREVVERSKLARIAHGVALVDEASLIAAVHSMGPQLAYLNADKEPKQSSLERALKSMMLDAAITSQCLYWESEGCGEVAENFRKYLAKKLS